MKKCVYVLFFVGCIVSFSFLRAQENPWVKQSKDKVSEIELVRIPGGTFWMGSQSEDANKNEQLVHKVSVTSFYIGKYELTQEQWLAIMGTNPAHFRKGKSYPVENVSWDDVQRFIQKLNQLTGKRYRLPTEAEWEYAARGGMDGPGNDRYGKIDDIAWYNGNSGGSTHPVGQKKPNAYGLYDMLGNVWEWCQDWHGAYTQSDKTNPTGPLSGTDRVDRGGGWYNDAGTVRAPFRGSHSPGHRLDNLGFRLAMDVE